MKKILDIVFLGLMLVGLVAVSGCATMEGLGKDIEKLGETIQEKVEE